MNMISVVLDKNHIFVFDKLFVKFLKNDMKMLLVSEIIVIFANDMKDM